MSQLAGINLLTTAYKLALILTRKVEFAESIVTAAIEAAPDQELSEASLLTEVATAAWERSRLVAGMPDVSNHSAIPAFPGELQNVVALPRNLRYCFSLRVLAGLTAHTCGSLIGLQPVQVDYLVQHAMQMLAKAAQREEQRMSAAAR